MDEAPTFTYLQNTKNNSEVKGLFVFTLYIKKKKLEENKGSIIFKRAVVDVPYVKGIQLYIDSIKKENSVFKNWKVLLYIDKPTLELLTEENVFIGDSVVDICLVKWSYYTPIEEGHINGDVMRCMRFRAFFDFTTIPVFLRDADTIFVTDLATDSCYIKHFKEDCKTIIYDWEKNYYEGALSYPNTWILASSIGYKREWHKNEKRGYFAPLGAFAGIQTTMPSVPCFQSEDLWKQAVKYILEDSQRIETEGKVVQISGMEYHMNGEIKYSNDNTTGKIGKDERILLFVFFPGCKIENIFFFELNFLDKRTHVLQGQSVRTPLFPKYIFSRGSNTNIGKLFTEAVYSENGRKLDTPFLVNLEAKRKNIVKRNYNAFKIKKEAFKNSLRNLKNKNYEFDESFNIPNLINDIYYSMEFLDTNKQLYNYFSQYKQEKEKSNLQKRNFITKMVYNNSTINTERAKLENSSYAKDKAMNQFLEKALSLRSKEDIISAASAFKQPKIKALLESYIQNSKKGGKRTRRKKRKN